MITKLPAHLENPIDAILGRLSVMVSPAILKGGLTANHVTLGSALCCALSLYSFTQDKTKTAAAFWTLNYILDCVDGVVARSHHLGGQETSFGALLDWSTDVVGYVGVFAVAFCKAKRSGGFLPLAIALALTLTASFHMSCQELVASGHIEITGLRYLPWQCTNSASINWSRWVGVGTANLAIVCMILAYQR